MIMSRNKNLLILLALVFWLFQPDLCAEIKKVAQTGYQFLKIDADARGAAMGSALTLAGQGASSMFYNPAGMSQQSAGLDFFSTHTNWLDDISYFSLGISKDMGIIGVVGFCLQTADYGEIIGTQVADNEAGYIETGNLNVDAALFGVSFARSLTDRFSVGGQIKFVSQNLGQSLVPGKEDEGVTQENKTSTMAYDFGTIYYPEVNSFRFGMSVRNFSRDIKYEDDPFQLPLTFTIGSAVDVSDFIGALGNLHDLLLSVDAVHPRDYTERINVGFEYGYNQMLFLRGGYKFNHDTEGLSLGAGVTLPMGGFGTHLNYSFNNANRFDPVHRITLGLSF